MRLLLLFFFSFLFHFSFSQDVYEVLVSSRAENAVKRYDADGNFLNNFVSPGSGGLANTEDILFHPDGSVLVSGFSNTAIKRYDGISGDFLGDFSAGYSLSNPSKMSIGPDSLIYVTQWAGSQMIVRFDLDGNFVDEFGAVPVPNGLGHIWDSDTNMYVVAYSDGSLGYVQLFAPDGSDLGQFINSDNLQGPTNIWKGNSGKYFISDWSAGNVKRFDATGVYESTIMSEMTNPEGIDSLENGDWLIGDWGLDRVHRYTNDGSYVGTFAVGDGLTDPNSVKIRLSPTVGIDEADDLAELSVVPSAGAGPFQITFSSKNLSTLSLMIINLNGAIIESRQLNVSDSYSWNPEGLPAGMYFVELRGEEGSWTEKIVLE